jgi:hypothetical protein
MTCWLCQTLPADVVVTQHAPTLGEWRFERPACLKCLNAVLEGRADLQAKGLAPFFALDARQLAPVDVVYFERVAAVQGFPFLSPVPCVYCDGRFSRDEQGDAISFPGRGAAAFDLEPVMAMGCCSVADDLRPVRQR